MNRKSFTGILISIAFGMALTACGTVQVETTSFVNSVNQQFQAELDKVPEVAGTGAGVVIQCPKTVEEGADFTCEVSGKLSGASRSVRLTTKATDDPNKDDVVPVSKAALMRAFGSVSTAEGKAAGEKIISGG